jgi:hypothetical protein
MHFSLPENDFKMVSVTLEIDEWEDELETIDVLIRLTLIPFAAEFWYRCGVEPPLRGCSLDVTDEDVGEFRLIPFMSLEETTPQ